MRRLRACWFWFCFVPRLTACSFCVCLVFRLRGCCCWLCFGHRRPACSFWMCFVVALRRLCRLQRSLTRRGPGLRLRLTTSAHRATAARCRSWRPPSRDGWLPSAWLSRPHRLCLSFARRCTRGLRRQLLAGRLSRLRRRQLLRLQLLQPCLRLPRSLLLLRAQLPQLLLLVPLADQVLHSRQRGARRAHLPLQLQLQLLLLRPVCKHRVVLRLHRRLQLRRALVLRRHLRGGPVVDVLDGGLVRVVLLLQMLELRLHVGTLALEQRDLL
mmetsp:Transcript_12446/g.31034  ORF Transcript_12446/g.31034 Transcript_12446/m.31034 type:complete len:270 (+) Transcript_12446:344-1153(+)